MSRIVISSPIGTLAIESSEGKILRIAVTKKKKPSAPDPLLKRCALELREYFAGKRKKFSVPLQRAGTSFQEAVWNAMSKIPYGKTKTYAEIARQIKRPKAVRAVGSACGKNPLLIIVPCHRVVGSNGGLGGFAAGMNAKKVLLAAEKASKE